MAQQTLNQESASTFRTKLNDNFTELYTGKAITNHASAAMDYGVSSASLFGHVKILTKNGLAITNGVLSLNNASTTVAGAVILVDNATTADATKAATAKALKAVKDGVMVAYSGSVAPSNSLGKNGDIYFKLV